LSTPHEPRGDVEAFEKVIYLDEACFVAEGEIAGGLSQIGGCAGVLGLQFPRTDMVFYWTTPDRMLQQQNVEFLFQN
jgi:hypothetical protein